MQQVPSSKLNLELSTIWLSKSVLWLLKFYETPLKKIKGLRKNLWTQSRWLFTHKWQLQPRTVKLQQISLISTDTLIKVWSVNKVLEWSRAHPPMSSRCKINSCRRQLKIILTPWIDEPMERYWVISVLQASAIFRMELCRPTPKVTASYFFLRELLEQLW